MSNNKENLEGLVSKLKEQGINAGNKEKIRIIEMAKEEASELISQAENRSNEIIEEAKRKAEQFEITAEASIKQASRDIIEATKMEVLNYLKSMFRQQTDKLFTQAQYSRELLKGVLEVLPGDKTISLNDSILREMEEFLVEQAMKDKIILKPLGDNNTQLIVESKGNGDVQFVLSSDDIEKGLFSLLNKELVSRITKGQEVKV